jgi:hypothetical protein
VASGKIRAPKWEIFAVRVDNFPVPGTSWAVMKRPALLFALVALVFAGCSSLDTHDVADLSSVQHIFVEHRLTDNHRIDEAIVAELKSRGYDASSGPLTMMPDNIDTIITYEDRWAWDFNSYLIDLTIEVRANFTHKPLARGHYHQASALTKSPPQVVHQIIDPMFKRRK